MSDSLPGTRDRWLVRGLQAASMLGALGTVAGFVLFGLLLTGAVPPSSLVPYGWTLGVGTVILLVITYLLVTVRLYGDS